jgi:hypothetical protein
MFFMVLVELPLLRNAQKCHKKNLPKKFKKRGTYLPHLVAICQIYVAFKNNFLRRPLPLPPPRLLCSFFFSVFRTSLHSLLFTVHCGYQGPDLLAAPNRTQHPHTAEEPSDHRASDSLSQFRVQWACIGSQFRVQCVYIVYSAWWRGGSREAGAGEARGEGEGADRISHGRAFLRSCLGPRAGCAVQAPAHQDIYVVRVKANSDSPHWPLAAICCESYRPPKEFFKVDDVVAVFVAAAAAAAPAAARAAGAGFFRFGAAGGVSAPL